MFSFAERNKIMRAAYREERDHYWAEKLTLNTTSGKNWATVFEIIFKYPYSK